MPPQDLPARLLPRALVCFAVVAVLVALDLWSKAAVFAWFEDPEALADFERTSRGHLRYPLIGGWLAFMENLNYGAAFGQGHQWPWVLVVGRGIAVLALSFLVVRAPRQQPVYLAALVWILAGALGNLYDNLFYEPRFPALTGRPDSWRVMSEQSYRLPQLQYFATSSYVQQILELIYGRDVLAPLVPAAPGDDFRMEVQGLGGCSVRFEA